MDTSKRLPSLAIIVLFATAFPAIAEIPPVSGAGPVVPLNLSLPRNSAPLETTSNHSQTNTAGIAGRADEKTGETAVAAASIRGQRNSCPRAGRNDCGALPYGTGFEARRRGAGGGLGRGR